jgi:hypothetical protein
MPHYFEKKLTKNTNINTSIDKKIENDQTVKFSHDRWLTNSSLQTYYPLLYEIVYDKNKTIDQV